MAKFHVMKILQRFVYDTLAVKHASFIVIGLVIFLWVSAVMVSDLLLGQGPCPAQCHCSDNLLGRPLLGLPCPDQPVDVVYTWVNGSEPEFRRQLRETAARLRRPVAPGWRQRCPLADCVPAAHLCVVPPLPRRLALGDLRYFLAGAAPLEMWASPLAELDATVLRFASVAEARRLLRRATRFSINQDNYTVHQTFWTSDERAPLSTPAAAHVMVTAAAAAAPELAVLPERAAVVARAADGGTAVLRLDDPAAADRLLARRNLTADNQTVTVRRARLALQLTTMPADAAAASRFADSQELRYSLRSLELYAPWVRRVYLVTNGQIPDWLSLDSARLTLVTHEEIFPNGSHLPTFSSPAIEAHLHRIPGLSERFLYFNDDVMLGRPVWPEDFYSAGAGYSVYLAWRVPDCAAGCTSLWLRDGHCDAACNTARCGWDGGDCVGAEPEVRPDDEPSSSTPPADDGDVPLAVAGDEDACAPGCADAWLGDQFCDRACQSVACAHDLGDCSGAALDGLARLGPLRDGAEYALPAGALAAAWNVSALAARLRLTAVTYPSRHAVRGIALSHRLGALTVLLRANQSLHRLPVIVSGLVPGLNGSAAERLIEVRVSSADGGASDEARKAAPPGRPASTSGDGGGAGPPPDGGAAPQPEPQTPSPHAAAAFRHLLSGWPPDGREDWQSSEPKPTGNSSEVAPSDASLLDTYGESLLHVSRLYTQRYGAEQRRAVAHMPHLLERAVIAELQALFPDEFERTSSARLRAPDDMQFAFAYFYYLMSEQEAVPAGRLFDELDTDGSGTWSDREIRTAMARLYPLPLTLRRLQETWALLRRCAEQGPAEPAPSTPAGERYLDSDLPTVGRAAALACPELVALLEGKLGRRRRFAYRVQSADEVAFTMVRANASRLVGALDELRRAPRKFLCLNNNVGDAPAGELRLVYALLVDFLEAMYPRASQFELPAHYRNRFQRTSELRGWRRRRRWLRAATVLLTLLLVLSLLHGQLEQLLRGVARRWRPAGRRRPAQYV